MKQSIPAIKVSPDTLENMRRAIIKYNESPNNNLILTIQDFRRLAYELLSQSILQGKDIPVKLRK